MGLAVAVGKGVALGANFVTDEQARLRITGRTKNRDWESFLLFMLTLLESV